MCRAAQNSVVGFSVELSCDARSNAVLYRAGQPIRRATVTLGNASSLQAQVTELVQDTVLDLTLRGVPGEYIGNQGLEINELVTLLTSLNARGNGTAVVGIAPRDDVRPSTRVDLFARIQ